MSARLYRWLILLCLYGTGLPLYAETVTYPRSPTVDDTRDIYPLKLLQLALDKAGATQQYTLRASDIPMLQGRALAELAHGSLVRIEWAMTSIGHEKALLPIRIPIFKGLIGWRLPLVREEHSDMLAAVHEIQGLRRFVAGQGHDWPDTDILRSNGIKVNGVPTYEALFRMLALARFDYFPRSIVEIWAEQEGHRQDGIAIDQHLLIRYPTAFYFFVNQQDTALADTIRRGLERAIADGSFDRLFCKQYAPYIAKAQLEHRTIIELSNPILPPETPLSRQALWFRIGQCANSK